MVLDFRMDRGKLNTYFIGFVIVAIAVSVFFIVDNSKLTGHATTDSQVGNLTASVQTYMACTWSDSSLNVDFGSLLNPGTNNIDATENYIQVNGTGYNVTVSPLTTALANITIVGNDLVDAAKVIGIDNVTYAVNSSDNDGANMIPGSSVPITGAATNIDSDVSPGTTEHYRFWLDVPTGTVAGNYVGNYTIECKEA